MLFTGYAELTIDSKGRLAIPAKYRNKWDAKRDGSCWVCVPWPGGILRLYTESRFERLAECLDDSLMPNVDEATLDAAFFSQAEQVTPDSAGRLMLPKRHMELTSLPTEVVVLGARNRLEVRARDAWKRAQDDQFGALPDLVERIEKRGERARDG